MGHTAYCDSTTIVASINKQGRFISSELCWMAVKLHKWSEVRMDLMKKNLVVNLLSRKDQIVGIEWSLHQTVADEIIPGVEQADDRPARNKAEHQAALLLLPSTKPKGINAGCLPALVGQHGHVRLSPSSVTH